MKCAALWAGLLALVAIPAWAGSIGLFATPDCTSCNLDVPLGTLGTFYVQAVPGRFTPLTGAEFRIAGLPPVFATTPVANAVLQPVAAQPAAWARLKALYR